MSIKADTKQLDRFARSMTTAEPVVREELRRAVTDSVVHIEGEAKRKVRVKTGRTRGMIIHRVKVSGRSVIGEVISQAPWSGVLEKGRGPVYPIRAKVLRWVDNGRVIFARRSGPAKGQPFMAPARTSSLPFIRARMGQSVRSITLKIGGR